MKYSDWQAKYYGNKVDVEYESGCGWWSVFKPVKSESSVLIKDRFKTKEEAYKWALDNGWVII